MERVEDASATTIVLGGEYLSAMLMDEEGD
jgi:hypothetical protein